MRTDRKGSGSTGRPASKEQTIEDKLKKAEAKIKLNGFIKNLPFIWGFQRS
ncbi:hypothetical protein ACFFIX_18495 [Metabacillus herbersteinensis]|uniref:Uncharacterized protein n=1 Tax=Metabacillus herbersteinensis TaxID=283816 RepID=A0ABV6GI87_9BACI